MFRSQVAGQVLPSSCQKASALPKTSRFFFHDKKYSRYEHCLLCCRYVECESLCQAPIWESVNVGDWRTTCRKGAYVLAPSRLQPGEWNRQIQRSRLGVSWILQCDRRLSPKSNDISNLRPPPPPPDTVLCRPLVGRRSSAAQRSEAPYAARLLPFLFLNCSSRPPAQNTRYH